MTFLARFQEIVARRGDAPCLVNYDEAGERREWSYARFAADAQRLAAFLHSLGVRPGDSVATVSRNRAQVYLAYFACWLLGAAACPVNGEESSARKRYILRNGGCRVALVEAEFAQEIAQAGAGLLEHRLPIETILLQDAGQLALTPHPSDTPAFLVYTSGTTGDPKGVLLRHSNLLANADATATWHGLAPGDRLMTVLPIHHVNGAIVTGLTAFLAGAANVLNRRFSPATFWARLAAEGAAMASVVPTLLQFLLSAEDESGEFARCRAGLGRLRYLLCGAGPLLSETALAFEDRFGVPICHGFGMSETTAYNTQMPMEISREARRRWYSAHGYPSIGCAIACNDVAILRGDGAEAAPLERGEIALRGPAVMGGYLNNSAANEAAFRHGWFHSGDQGFFMDDPDGRRFFFLSGRLKELIIRGGVNFSPLEIDEVLKRLPGVAFALAVPFENLYYGEEVAAYVVPESGAVLDAEAVIAFARQHLPYARSPKVVLFGQEVPFTATGKPKRIELARLLAPRLAAYRDVQFRE